MLIWFLSHVFEWNALWYAHPGNPKSMVDFLRAGPRWYIGRWTGPDQDLICVRRAKTKDEAKRYLSPAGWTPLDAALRGTWTIIRTLLEEQQSQQDAAQHNRTAVHSDPVSATIR